MRYDALGRIEQSRQRTQATTGGPFQEYNFAYAYNRADELVSMTYPSMRTVSYATDSLGRINGVTGLKNGIQTFYASGFGYAPHGVPTKFQLGGWMNQTCFNSRLQVTTIRRGAAAQTNCGDPGGDSFRIEYGWKCGVSI